MSMVLSIDKHHPVRPRERFRFEGTGLRVIKIGRLRSSHIPLDEAAASRVQGVIRVRGSQACFENMGRHDSVLLNDQPVAPLQVAELYSDDVLRIGTTELRVRLRPLGTDATPAGISVDLVRAMQRAGDATSMEVRRLLHSRRRRRTDQHSSHARATAQPQPAAVEHDPISEPVALDAADEAIAAKEKYHTDFLIAQMKRREHSRRLAILLTLLAAVLTWSMATL